ncbi:MAG: DoxX family protein [Acidimicrobiales bacterium]
MEQLSTVLAVVLIVACWATAVADFRRAPQIVATMERLGVPLRMLPLLGAVKVAGGLGLLLGQWNDTLRAAASLCLAVYFAGATAAHLRRKDAVQHIAPAGVLLVCSAVVFAVSL